MQTLTIFAHLSPTCTYRYTKNILEQRIKIPAKKVRDIESRPPQCWVCKNCCLISALCSASVCIKDSAFLSRSAAVLASLEP